MKFKKIALIGKYQDITLTERVIHLASHLKTLGVEVYLDGSNLDHNSDLSNMQVGYLKDWLSFLDLVVVIGGDGTFLSAARVAADYDIPIIGINQGKLGFMTDIAVNDMIVIMDEILLQNKFTEESRSIMFAEVSRNKDIVKSGIALNDIVISRGAIGSMIEFDLTINSQFVLSQKSDGVIFSTPTGSTAYSLAAGGPILHPEANVFSIVPICPQSLSNRPIVVSDKVLIEFLLIKENTIQIHFDGQECFDLSYQDRVLLHKYPKSLNIIHPQSYNYYRTLRRKLDWSKRVS